MHEPFHPRRCCLTLRYLRLIYAIFIRVNIFGSCGDDEQSDQCSHMSTYSIAAYPKSVSTYSFIFSRFSSVFESSSELFSMSEHRMPNYRMITETLRKLKYIITKQLTDILTFVGNMITQNKNGKNLHYTC